MKLAPVELARIAAAVVPGLPLERWRSDDLALLVDRLRGLDAGALDVVGVLVSTLLGIALAFLTYAAGVAWSRWLEGRAPAEPAG